jgi:hypothetical protein
VSHGSVLCPQTRGHGFPQPAPTGQTVVAEKTENGVETICISTPPKKNIKHLKPQKNLKNTKSQKKIQNTKTQKEKTWKKYRGKGKLHSRESTFTVFLANLRGYKTKELSLKKILRKVKPSMILFNETLLTGKANIKLTPYSSWCKNRTEKGGGGIASGVRQEYKDCSVQAGEGQEDDEYIITRVECFQPALNVINCYGEQRSTKKEDVEDKWRRLVKDMEDIRTKGEFCLLSGDMNKLVGCGSMGVEGNNSEISLGGKLLRGLLATNNWFLVNNMGQGVVQGGPFTRKDPASGKESCLDLFVVSSELRPYVKSLMVDSDREITVSRAVRRGSGYQRVYSDHYTCILTLGNLPRVRERKEEKRVVWNLAKEGGWEQYSLLSEKYSEVLENIIESKEISVEEKMIQFDRIHDKIKFKAFGKVSLSGNNKKKENNDNEDAKKTSEKEEVEEQERKAEVEIEEIKRMKLSKVGKVWEIRRRIIGGKKLETKANAIEDPITEKLVVSRNKIKEVALKYCKDTLTNNVPDKAYKEEIHAKKVRVDKELKKCTDKLEISEGTFTSILSKFKLSRKRNYDFLVKAGKGFQNTVFKFCKVMVEEEKFPESFKNTTLHMIFKGGKGRKEKLSNSRFIHS